MSQVIFFSVIDIPLYATCKNIFDKIKKFRKKIL